MAHALYQVSGKLKAFEFLVLSIYFLFNRNRQPMIFCCSLSLSISQHGITFFFVLSLSIYFSICCKWNLPQNKRDLYTKIRVHKIYIFNAKLPLLTWKLKKRKMRQYIYTQCAGRKWQIKLQMVKRAGADGGNECRGTLWKFVSYNERQEDGIDRTMAEKKEK